MARWSHGSKVWGDLVGTASDYRTLRPVVDLAHDEDDALYWRIWEIDALAGLRELADAEQVAGWLADFSVELTPRERYRKIAAQLAREQARRLEPVEYVCEDGCFAVYEPDYGDFGIYAELPY